LAFTLAFAVILALLLSNLRIAGDAERLLVLRFGRFHRVAGPGIALLVPFVDRGIRVDLDEVAPGWRSIAAAELEARLEDYAMRLPPG